MTEEQQNKDGKQMSKEGKRVKLSRKKSQGKEVKLSTWSKITRKTVATEL